MNSHWTKRSRISFLAFAGLVAFVAGLNLACTSAHQEPNPATNQGPLIVTSTPILEGLVQQVAPIPSRVSCLLPKGDPHHGEPLPQNVHTLTQADFFLTLPQGAEPWVDNYLNKLKPGAVVIRPEDLITLPRSPYDSPDDHFWMDPISLGNYVSHLANRVNLPQRDPDDRRSEHFQGALHDAANRALQRRVEFDLRDQGVLLVHPSSYSLLQYLKIPVVQVLQPAGDLAEPSLLDLNKANQLADKGKILFVLEDLFESTGGAATVAKNLGLPLVQIRSQPEAGEDLVAWWREQADLVLDFLEKQND